MSLRRAVLGVGSLFTRRFSPRTAAAGTAAAAFAGVGGLFYHNKGADESAARKEEEAMKGRFEDFVKKYNKIYRDEEERAMRFLAFKDNVEWIASQPASAQEKLLPESFFVDYTHRERQRMTMGPMVDCKEFQDHIKETRAKRERGEPVSYRRPSVKKGEGDTRATPASV